MNDNTEPLNIPVEAFHTQEWKESRRIQFGVFTGLLDTIVTAHGRSVGMFFNNEKIKITDIDIDGEYAEITGRIYEQEKQ